MLLWYHVKVSAISFSHRREYDFKVSIRAWRGGAAQKPIAPTGAKSACVGDLLRQACHCQLVLAVQAVEQRNNSANCHRFKSEHPP